MKTNEQQAKYDIIFQKLNHFRVENADVKILCDEFDNYLDTSSEIINEMKALSEENLASNIQCYSGA